MFSYSAGVGCKYPRVAEAVGTVLVLAFAFVFAAELRQLACARVYEPGRIIVVFFIGFSLVFALNAAVGRVCLGVCAAVSDRYTALLTPA